MASVAHPVVEWECWCGTVYVATVDAGPRGTILRMLSGGTRALCPHWREAHLRLGDLAGGLDPGTRCDTCGRNPCTGGGPPGSCG
jgi:hypothetical protein